MKQETTFKIRAQSVSMRKHEGKTTNPVEESQLYLGMTRRRKEAGQSADVVVRPCVAQLPILMHTSMFSQNPLAAPEGNGPLELEPIMQKHF